MISPSCEPVSCLKWDCAPLPEVGDDGFDLFLDGTPLDRSVYVLDVNAGHGSVFVDSDVGGDDRV